VLELYAGSGALGLRLAARGARVTAVESFEPARRRLDAAALAQSLEVATAAGDSEAFVAALGGRGRGGSPRTREFDVVLVNPPRRGLSAQVRSGLAQLGPRLVVYVSCNPETLARDASHLTLLGWQAQSLAAFDLIPLTDALESLALFAPAPPPLPRVLFEDACSLALYKLPFEPTTPQGESNLSLLERARVGLGLPELTPIHRLDQGTSGVCWFARSPSLVAPLARALERGHKTYLALGMGVTHKKGAISRPLNDAGKLRPATTRYRRLELV
jgi:23S rRNA (uracil1939-C5)-methyltransferase